MDDLFEGLSGERFGSENGLSEEAAVSQDSSRTLNPASGLDNASGGAASAKLSSVHSKASSTISVSLPSQLEVLSSILSPLDLGTTVITPSGPELNAKITFSGAGLSWLADGTLKDANGALLASAAGSSVTLVGTPTLINGYLSKGSLRMTTTSDLSLSVSVSYGVGVASNTSVALKVVNPLVTLSGVPDIRDYLPNGFSVKANGLSYYELLQSDLTNLNNSRGDNYTSVGSGWLKTNEAGVYYFYAVADDVLKFQVFDDQNNVIGVAYDPNADNTVRINGSNSFGANSIAGLRKSGPVYLDANKYYRFQFDFQEVTGGDLFEIGYTKASLTTSGIYVTNVVASSENYPPIAANTNDEKVSNTFDGTNNKYLNIDEFGDKTTGRDSGLMVRLSESVSLTSVQFRSAADSDFWDPTTYTVFGSNSPLAWSSSAWGTALSSGSTNLTSTRSSNGNLVTVSGASAFQYYKIVFPTTRGSSSNQYYMQVGEIYLGYGTVTGTGSAVVNTAVVKSAPESVNNVPSLLTANGAVFNMVPDLSGTTITANLSVTGSGVLAVYSGGTAITNGTTVNGATVTANNSSSVTISGSYASINNLLQATSAVRYSLSLAGNSLSIRLSGPGLETSTDGGSFSSPNKIIDFYGVRSGNLVTVSSVTSSGGSSPVGEEVAKVIDGSTETKYLNTAGPGSGLTMTLSPTGVMDSMLLVSRTNDDIWQWDPKTWQVYGSNTNAIWSDTNWVSLGSGNTNLADARESVSMVSFVNTTAYKFYKVVFPTTKGTFNNQTYLHISEVNLFRAPQVKSGGMPDLRALSPEGWTQRMWFDLTTTNNATLITLQTASLGTQLDLNGWLGLARKWLNIPSCSCVRFFLGF